MESKTVLRDDDLKALERRVWSRFFQDGFWEFFFGMMFVAMGLRELADNIMFTFLIFIGILVMIFGKRFITTPRMGVVRFNERRRTRRRWVLFVILLANLLTGVLLVLTLFTGFKPGPGVTAPIIGGSVLFIFLLVAYLLDYWKFAVYGSVLVAGIVLMEAGVETAASLVLITGGTALIAYGGYLLITFLKENPLKEEG